MTAFAVEVCELVVSLLSPLPCKNYDRVEVLHILLYQGQAPLIVNALPLIASRLAALLFSDVCAQALVSDVSVALFFHYVFYCLRQ